MNLRTVTRHIAALSAIGVLSLGTAACGSGQDTAGETPSSASGSDAGGAAPSDAGDGSSAPSDGEDASDGGGTSDSGDGSGSAAGSSDSLESTDSSGSGAEGEDVAACSASDLEAAVEQTDSAAGHLHYDLQLTNTSDDPCRVSGYPGLSVVAGEDGEQIGADAQRAADEGEPAVLIPNATAQATIEAVNIGDDGGPLDGSCDPVDADGWRVYPPESQDALFVEQDGLKACSEDTEWLTVTGVHPTS